MWSPCLRQRLNGIGDGRCAGGRGQSGHAALKGRHALLEHVLRGVCQAAVDVARVRQAEAGRSLRAVAEHIGCRLRRWARRARRWRDRAAPVRREAAGSQNDSSWGCLLCDSFRSYGRDLSVRRYSGNKKAGAENSSRSEKRSWSAAPHSRHAPRMAARPASSSAREPSIRSAAKNIAATSLRLMDAS